MLSTIFHPGTPAWLDLNAPDLDGAAEFYGAVFGWTYSPISGDHGLLKRDEKTVAALGRQAPSKTVGWCVYFTTSDAQALAPAVDGAGGVGQSPVDVFGTGRVSVCEDPNEVEFGLWQAGDEVKGIELVNEPGALVWVELHVAAPAPALAFYRSLLGWDAKVNRNHRVRVFPSGMDTSASFGGAVQLRQGHPAHWLPFFQVDDVGATVATVIGNGGSEVYPATDSLGWLRDPWGGYFGIMLGVPAQ